MYPQYSIDFGLFPLHEDITEACNRVALREESDQVSQEGLDEVVMTITEMVIQIKMGIF